MAGIPTSFTWRRAMTGSDLPSTTKLVLFVIAEYANAIDDTCWPSIEEIACKASLSDRAIFSHLEIAIERGWLVRWKTRRRERKWAHCHYRLALPEDVARKVRDDIDLSIAGASELPERDSAVPQKMGKLPERRSGDAQEIGMQPEPRSGNSGKLPERSSSDARKTGNSGAPDESYLHHVPTNNPVNGVYVNTSLSIQKPPTSMGSMGTGRENCGQGDDSARLAGWMAARLKDADPLAAVPDLDAWVCDVALLVSTDGRDEAQIVRLWTWALQDGFWRNVVTTPARLRKHWDELRRRRNRAKEVAVGADGQQGAEPACRQCAHVDDAGTRCSRTATTIIGAGSARRGYCRLHVGHYEN